MKVFGVFEVLVVLLIVLGDSLGGVLFLLTVLGEIFFLLWGRFVAGTIATWNNAQLEDVKQHSFSSPASWLSSESDSSSAAQAASLNEAMMEHGLNYEGLGGIKAGQGKGRKDICWGG